ncbi:MAG: hypothetical protein ABWX92_17970 [Mycetocola sp.]
MPEFIGERTVKSARKTHACRTCFAPAALPGEAYKRQTYAYDGRVYDWVSCSACDEICGEVHSYVMNDEGVTADDYYEWANELRDDPKHGADARAYLARRSAAIS